MKLTIAEFKKACDVGSSDSYRRLDGKARKLAIMSNAKACLELGQITQATFNRLSTWADKEGFKIPGDK